MAFNFSPKVVTDGLVLCLDAANTKSYVNGSTIWNDISRGGNTGTLVNGPTFSSGNGGNLDLTGNKYIRITTLNPYLNNVNKFTYETWIKINNPASSATQTIFSFGQGNLYNNDIMFFANLNSLYFQINNGADGGPTLSYTSTTWNNISLVYDGSQTGNVNRMKVYINGVLGVLGFNTYTVPASTTNGGYTNAAIGAYSTAGYNNFLAGNISVSKLYTRALSATEVLQNYNATKTRFGL